MYAAQHFLVQGLALKTDAEREADRQERIQIVPAAEVFPYSRQPYTIDRPTPDLVRLMDSIEHITRVKRQLNPKLEVDGIVLTMVDSRTTLAREINALVRKTYGGHVFASEIPRSIKAAEISVENKSIYDHDRSGKAALAYENLTREVLSIGKQIKRHRTDPVR